MQNDYNDKILISFVIVNYNLANEIENCLDSLIKNVGEINFEVIIVDNNSPDKKLYETEKKFSNPNIHYYYLDDNLGFGKGCNYGYAKSKGTYICFLNPDTLINDPLLEPIIELFKDDDKIGIIGPKQQLRYKVFDFSAGYFPNVVFEFFNLFCIGTFVEALLVFIITSIKGKKYLQMDWILGAAIFIRSDLFKKINGFDRDFFMFFEEVDLSKRAIESGFKVIYYPSVKINHLGSVSGKRDYSLFTKRIYSSKFIFISKHYKSINKSLMNFFLTLQLFSQLILWIAWFPFNSLKSKQKINAFIYLIKQRIKLL
ncbi:MAG: glycosyltransferase family 2 protein [Ignavibacteriaceae bacterium]|nr:glycosyltransferase family 2 protein [Ignavibacteriaceae bacterium]